MILTGGAAGACITWFATDRRERNRDREQRKREFRGYLGEFRSRIERESHENDAQNKLWNSYKQLVHVFHRERAKVSADFKPTYEFKRLCKNFGELRHSDYSNDPKKRVPRDVLAEALDELIEFTKR